MASQWKKLTVQKVSMNKNIFKITETGDELNQSLRVYWLTVKTKSYKISFQDIEGESQF